MDWFNYYGLIAVVVLMIPNIVFAIKHKGEFQNNYKNKVVEVLEQIGRYGCFALMIFNIPYTYFGFWFGGALIAYLVVNAVLLFAYCVLWAVFFNKNCKARALTLSIIPSVIFLFSGIMLANIPLIVFAVLFAVNHILLSYKNAVAEEMSDNMEIDNDI